jgi:hypothetical protein
MENFTIRLKNVPWYIEQRKTELLATKLGYSVFRKGLLQKKIRSLLWVGGYGFAMCSTDSLIVLHWQQMEFDICEIHV